MTLPDLDQSQAPEGYEYRWEPVEDGNGYSGDWRVIDEVTGILYRCRWGAGPGRPACGAPSVIKLNRGHGKERWWYYCGEHMYGRVLHAGTIWQRVLRPVDGS
jgi:hypothetical protein